MQPSAGGGNTCISNYEEKGNMLKIKKGFILRKLGTEHMAVAIGEASRNFNGMIRLNETGAFYW